MSKIVQLNDYRGKFCSHRWADTIGKNDVTVVRCTFCKVLQSPRWSATDPSPCDPQFVIPPAATIEFKLNL